MSKENSRRGCALRQMRHADWTGASAPTRPVPIWRSSGCDRCPPAPGNHKGPPRTRTTWPGSRSDRRMAARGLGLAANDTLAVQSPSWPVGGPSLLETNRNLSPTAPMPRSVRANSANAGSHPKGSRSVGRLGIPHAVGHPTADTREAAAQPTRQPRQRRMPVHQSGSPPAAPIGPAKSPPVREFSANPRNPQTPRGVRRRTACIRRTGQPSADLKGSIKPGRHQPAAARSARRTRPLSQQNGTADDNGGIIAGIQIEVGTPPANSTSSAYIVLIGGGQRTDLRHAELHKCLLARPTTHALMGGRPISSRTEVWPLFQWLCGSPVCSRGTGDQSHRETGRAMPTRLAVPNRGGQHRHVHCQPGWQPPDRPRGHRLAKSEIRHRGKHAIPAKAWHGG